MAKLLLQRLNPYAGKSTLCFILICCLGYIHPVFSQVEKELNQSPIISWEASVSTIRTNQGSTQSLFGIALCNYWYLLNYGPEQKRSLGLDLFSRYILIEESALEEDDRVLNYKGQFALALLLRWDRHLLGTKRKLGFFYGIGPEVRTNFKSNRYGFVPFAQQEIGINWQHVSRRETIKSYDFGLAVSHPLHREERQLSMTIGSLFMRYGF